MRRIALFACALVLGACSGGGGSSSPPAPPPPPPAARDEHPVSGASPFAAGCGASVGTPFIGAEVEPHLVVDPRDPNHLVAAWQQDRWSNGAARGLAAAASFDGGITWSPSVLPFSDCAGGTAALGNDFVRATDPWLAFAADGAVLAIGLGTRGASFASGSANGVLAARSTDGGRTWGAPVALIRDGDGFLNDKETISADPLDARYAYATWDRIDAASHGVTYFTRTTDGGATWEAARPVRDPGAGQQTIGNLVRVLPDATLVLMYSRLAGDESHVTDAALEAMRSTDRGATWSAPVRIAAFQPLGARDPRNGQAIRDGSILAQMAVAPDGSLAVAWQDGRFAGTHDAIALARSTDAGRTWSAPLRVNADAGATAFTAQVHVRADGTIGVTYFTLQPGASDAGALPADHRLAQSADGEHWSETVVAGPFDLAAAPIADGLFLGDYMGLASAGTTFLPLYVRTTGAMADRTNVYLARVAAGGKRGPGYLAQAAPAAERGADFARRVGANLARGAASLRERSPTPSAVRSEAP